MTQTPTSSHPPATPVRSRRTIDRRADPQRAKRDLTAFLYQAEARGDMTPELWVVNLSSLLIPIEIDIMGQDRGVRLPPLPVSGHPHCLTRDIDLETLVKSRAMRELLRARYRDPFDPRSPQNGKFHIELWTEEEASEHYQQIADQRGRGESWEEVWNEVSQERTSIDSSMEVHYTEETGFLPPRSAMELAGMDLARRGFTAGVSPGGGYTGTVGLSAEEAQRLLAEEQEQHRNLGMAPGQMYVADPVDPKITQLCHEAGNQVPPGQRIPALAFMQQLAKMAHIMTEADFDYLQAHGNYAQVRQWAGRMREAKFFQSEGGSHLTSSPQMVPMPASPQPPGRPGPGGFQPASQSLGSSMLASFANAPGFAQQASNPAQQPPPMVENLDGLAQSILPTPPGPSKE